MMSRLLLEISQLFAFPGKKSFAAKMRRSAGQVVDPRLL
jgi:hypothetical protein